MQVGESKVNAKVGFRGYYHEHNYHFHFIEALSESLRLQHEHSDKNALHQTIKSLVNRILTGNVLRKKFPHNACVLLYFFNMIFWIPTVCNSFLYTDLRAITVFMSLHIIVFSNIPMMVVRYISVIGSFFKPQKGIGSKHLRWLWLVTHRRSAYYNNILCHHVSSIDNTRRDSKNTWKIDFQPSR